MVAIGRVTGQTIAENRDGVTAVRLLQVEMSAPGDVQTVQYMPMAGDDSPPQNGDLVAVLSIGPAFQVALAVQDSVVPSMAAGEKKVYARDGAGDIAAFLNLRASGDLELNGSGNSAVTFAQLKTVIDAFVIALNALFATKLDGGGAAGLLTLDITAAESPTVKLP